MKIPKPTGADRDRFHSLVPAGTGVETKPMFGNLGAFVNGNMFMGLFGSDIGIKLPDDARAKLLAMPGTGPFGPEERPMSGYVTIPPEWTSRNAASWIAQALSAAAAPPAKTTKAKAKNSR